MTKGELISDLLAPVSALHPRGSGDDDERPA